MPASARKPRQKNAVPAPVGNAGKGLRLDGAEIQKLLREAKKEGRRLTLDGWFNMLTGLGNQQRDKRWSSQNQRDILAYEDCLDLYRGDDLAARVVEAPADEMLREGFEIKIKPKDDASAADTKQLEEDCSAWLKGLDTVRSLHEGVSKARAFGGAGIFVGAMDGQKDLTKPLDMTRIQTVDFLTSLDARELQATAYYGNPLTKQFGFPEVYRVVPQTVSTNVAAPFMPMVHETRLLRFQGAVVSRRQLRENVGWGDSVFVRVYQVLRDFQVSWDSAAVLVQDFAQAVFKIKGLAELVANDQSAQLSTRMQLIDMSRSVVRAALIDSDGEEFSRVATPVTGLPELLEKFMLRMAAAAQIPVSVLMGQAPAGLNATGDSDMRWFYDRIAAMQERYLKPQVEALARIMFACKTGPTKGEIPDNWTVQFKPLYQLDETQQADVRLKQSTADGNYIDRGVLLPEEVAQSRFGSGTFSTKTTLSAGVRGAASLQTGKPGASAPGAGGSPTTPGQPVPRPTPSDNSPGKNSLPGQQIPNPQSIPSVVGLPKSQGRIQPIPQRFPPPDNSNPQPLPGKAGRV
jgi:phage-related protein (TIGR01555 family)